MIKSVEVLSQLLTCKHPLHPLWRCLDTVRNHKAGGEGGAAYSRADSESQTMQMNERKHKPKEFPE